MLRLATYIVLVLILITLVINVYVFSYSRQYILSGEISTSTPFMQASTTEISTTPVALPIIFGTTTDSITAAPSQNQPFPVAIILGASVYSDGTLSPLLEARAKTGLELYRHGLVRKILVSGDNRLSSYNEVMPIRTYLLAAGVPPADVFTDFAGFNTYDSMYRAQAIFGVTDVLIVSQNFHLPRALFVARSLGLNAYGVPAMSGTDGGAGNFLSGLDNNVRELGATVKTFFEAETGAKPYFLGRQIPITGDGRGSLK